MFVAVGSYDDKVRLLNAMTWRAVGEMECAVGAGGVRGGKVRDWCDLGVCGGGGGSDVGGELIKCEGGEGGEVADGCEGEKWG
jgi:hypothetical protein